MSQHHAEPGPVPPQPVSSSGFAPLAQPVFAVLWVAAVLGNTVTFKRDVPSSWLVNDLSA